MKYAVNQPIWHVEIGKYKELPKYSCQKDGIKIENLEILGVSKYKVALNDDWFTTVDNDDRENYRKDRSVYRYIDDINVRINTNNSLLGDGIFISLYSSKKPTKKLLNKMVVQASLEIDKNYGFLYKGAVSEIQNIVDNYEADDNFPQ
jgi:hypothetical protein